MAPSRTGSISIITTATQDSSASITVPADAELALICFGAYSSSGINFSSLTLGGAACTQVVVEGTDANFNMGAIWKKDTPATGTQTLAWTFSNGIAAGAVIYVVYYKDVDVATGSIRGSGSGKASAGTATSSSFNSATDDICLCVGADDGSGTADAGQAGQTEIATQDYNTLNVVLGEKAGVSGTTTMRVDGTFAFVCGVSIRGTASGAASIIAQAMRSYRARRI